MTETAKMASLDHAPVWIWSATRTGELIESSPYVDVLSGGVSVEPDNWFALLSPGDRDRFRNELAACEQSGAPLRRFFHALHLPDQAPIEVETDCRVHTLADGEAILTGVTREAPPDSDISANALRYLNAVPILLAVTDEQGATEFVNETVLHPMRLRPEAVRGVPFHELPCWAHDEGVQATLRDAMVETREGRCVVAEIEARIAGVSLPMKYTCDPIFDDEGEVLTLLHTGTPLVEQRRIRNELQRKLEVIERQAQAIRVMGTPVLEIWSGIFVIPIVGTLDTQRSEALMDAVLGHIAASGARFGLLDITGVDTVDTNIADHLLRVVQAAKLLGTTCVLTGLSPSIAQSLAELQVTLPDLVTLKNVKGGLIHCLRALSSV